MSDYNLTLFEACEVLNRSKKSISRYIRQGLLHPEQVKSQQGTLEYRFSKEDLEAFKALKAEKTDQTGHLDQTRQGRQDTLKRENRLNKVENDQSRQDTPEETGHGRQDKTGQDSEIIKVLKETTGLLKGQLIKKDDQIKDLGGKIDELIQRDRETNILLKGLQDRVFMLEGVEESQNKPKNGVYETERYKEPQEAENKPTEANTGGKQRQEEVREKPKRKGFWQRIFK